MEDFIMLEECPLCRGAGMIVHEIGRASCRERV